MHRMPLSQLSAPAQISNTSPLQMSVDKLKESLLDNRVSDDVLALALGVGLRQLYNYTKRGLPYVRIGNRRYFDIDECRAWLVADATRKVDEQALAPRPVGHPRKYPLPLK